MTLQLNPVRALAAVFLAVICWCSGAPTAGAHHVLGRPSYALNEDSNTPSAMQVETQIGSYFVNYMVFPAFPRPNETGRINLYVRKLDGGAAYGGKIAFSVRDNSWAAWLGLAANAEKLGSQVLDDNVYRQGFVFRERGAYVITASFKDGDTPYTIDFPLQVGAPSPFGPIGIAATLIVAILLGVALVQRRRALSGQIRGSHARNHQDRS
ncbi:MAG: hypothetical protein GY947_05120 [Rhodobacteraceae bacterium]|nr:hypothetical protein [Paracoccaceae bacterium]